jgi:hypothetical protein
MFRSGQSKEVQWTVFVRLEVLFFQYSLCRRKVVFRRIFLAHNPESMSSSSYPVVGDESLMADKGHGTSAAPVQQNLRSFSRDVSSNSFFQTDGRVMLKLRIIFVHLIVTMLSILGILKKLLFYKRLIVKIQSLFMIL